MIYKHTKAVGRGKLIPKKKNPSAWWLLTALVFPLLLWLWASSGPLFTWSAVPPEPTEQDWEGYELWKAGGK